ncbi:unnamed protein product [Darwinula stevensoni]|uniref:Uncharacterized protein n=1 Tax=Darwinula stevensoni TaxID=69355 RepID=A0A7R8XCS7_9CRUS|nr:unnamed protein product [Darwinula stevensoni]CAG0893632.1 unnamed protein product [Darwinula stevensoni]
MANSYSLSLSFAYATTAPPANRHNHTHYTICLHANQYRSKMPTKLQLQPKRHSMPSTGHDYHTPADNNAIHVQDQRQQPLIDQQPPNSYADLEVWIRGVHQIASISRMIRDVLNRLQQLRQEQQPQYSPVDREV